MLRSVAAAELSVAGVQLPSRSSVQVGDVLDDLGVARVRFRHGARRQSARRVEPSTLHLHALHLAFLRLRELRGDDDETQVDQEEGPDLREGEESEAFQAMIWIFNFFFYFFINRWSKSCEL